VPPEVTVSGLSLLDCSLDSLQRMRDAKLLSWECPSGAWHHGWAMHNTVLAAWVQGCHWPQAQELQHWEPSCRDWVGPAWALLAGQWGMVPGALGLAKSNPCKPLARHQWEDSRVVLPNLCGYWMVLPKPKIGREATVEACTADSLAKFCSTDNCILLLSS